MWLSKILEVASEDRLLFVSDLGGISMCTHVANTIFDKSIFSYLVQNFDKLCSLKLERITEKTNELQRCILLQIKDRVKDCFDENGSAIATGIMQRINTNWQHFLNGVFSLCVAKPDCIANIVHIVEMVHMHPGINPSPGAAQLLQSVGAKGAKQHQSVGFEHTAPFGKQLR